MIIMKFGGASFSDGKQIINTCRIVSKYRPRHRIVVVASAMRGVTDQLFEIVEKLKKRKTKDALSVAENIEKKHLKALNTINPGKNQVVSRIELIKLLSQLQYFIKKASKKEINPARSDYIVSFGERLSIRLVAEALQKLKIGSYPVDASNLLATTGAFSNAVPLPKEKQYYLARILVPLIDCGITPVVTGYIGYSKDGCTTTLGRGGSDLSASFLANFLSAKAVYLWKDVLGFYSKDPKSHKDVKLFTKLAYTEAEELAKKGAKVIYYKAIWPVRKKKIPIYVKSFLDIDAPGTVIKV